VVVGALVVKVVVVGEAGVELGAVVRPRGGDDAGAVVVVVRPLWCSPRFGLFAGCGCRLDPVIGDLTIVSARVTGVVGNANVVVGRVVLTREVGVALTRDVVVVGPGAASALWGGSGGGMVGGAAWAANAPPTVKAAAPMATCVPVARACAPKRNLARNGRSANQETGPIVQRSRPMEMFRNALTMAGSNWLPA
jgi:hypothetical protein